MAQDVFPSLAVDTSIISALYVTIYVFKRFGFRVTSRASDRRKNILIIKVSNVIVVNTMFLWQINYDTAPFICTTAR